ncbi:hypothetical protein G4H71_09680 [Rhodococcus triatomae]|uniref:Excreted virulence factor EspC, type VII ESX diderm n=1 Tax=Rhodococcus triatomae TaxID=300028 RepID=A0A1G8SR84_9NOCA|nr:hypothetical protein [Rhodococcus triatomae]QNG20819.1 hypothetical protein G4H72_20705 [Rhodococcus triatomae]QNG23266.1 hypothetical protein G4H71_09680 [Rhodococcus triatomae]SDJ31752.1 hypothetical protein SAMN05444695_12326 [Rhodococcus triatomae]
MADRAGTALHLDDESRGRLARACRALIDALTGIESKASRLAVSDGYGDLPSARELAAKFGRLGGPEGIQATLREHIAVVARIEETLKKSFDQYDDADLELMEQLSSVGSRHPDE